MLTIEAEPSVEASSIARSSATLENCDIDENVSPAPKMEDFYGEPIAESKLAKKRQVKPSSIKPLLDFIQNTPGFLFSRAELEF
jgi:hypothetical protein